MHSRVKLVKLLLPVSLFAWAVGSFAPVPALTPQKEKAADSEALELSFQTKSTPIAQRKLTYAQDIASILNNKCVSCHQPGGSAPFSLASYQDLKKRLSTVDTVIAARYMPPWKPAIGYASFQDERFLSDADISSIREWIKQGGQSGDLSKLATPHLNEASKALEWRNGKPDLIIRMPQAFSVTADGPDIYRCFVFPLNFANDKFVSHVEFHPGNPKVLHHALFFLDTLGAARKKDAQDAEPGFSSFGGPGFLPTGGLGGWAPGNSMLPLPDGISRLVRKNSDLVVQMHFHPSGKEEQVQAELGIYFSKTAPKKIIMPLTVRSRNIDIPAGDKSYKVKSTCRVPADFDLLQVTPHAHLLCREIKCSASTPEGVKIPLIWIKNWDFNWQEQYAYKTPVHLPEGSVVEAEFTYDNSEDNFRNPNHPPKRVKWGEQTGDEMALIFFGGVVSRNEDASKYMRGMLLGVMRDLPLLDASPANAFKAFKLIMSNRNNPLKQLPK
ncbi:MAG: cytochrome c [Candidatus Obscuribacterales bacterium]|nr:cytochrome c [Candidatus Obscuribacterales bacterium]